MRKKQKTPRQLHAIGKRNVIHARRKVGDAWKLVQDMNIILSRLRRARPLTLNK